MTITIEKRTRLTIDVPPEVKSRLRLAAARRDISMRRYVQEVLEERLTDDLPTDLRSSLEAIDDLRNQLDAAIALDDAEAVAALSAALVETARTIDRRVAIDEGNGKGVDR